MDYVDTESRTKLVDAIRPHLPGIRSTPYGRRIQAKIQSGDGHSARSSGNATPADASTGQIPIGRQSHQRGLSNASQTSSFMNPVTNYMNPVNNFTNGFGMALQQCRLAVKFQAVLRLLCI